MKFETARQHYIDFSGRASDVARQLAFAGIAAVWLFRPENTSGLGLPSGLMLTMTGLALFFLFDLLQYVYATAAWGFYQWHHEDVAKAASPGDEAEGEIPDSPDWINYATLAFFSLKLLVLTLAYIAFVAWLVR